MRRFNVRFATRSVAFETDKFSSREALATAVARGRVVRVQVCPYAARKHYQWLNLARVEAIL